MNLSSVLFKKKVGFIRESLLLCPGITIWKTAATFGADMFDIVKHPSITNRYVQGASWVATYAAVRPLWRIERITHEGRQHAH